MLAPSLIYNQLTGNCYAASLYLALISLLENSDEDLAGKRIGLFSYGSGCMGEFFSAVVEEGYRDHLKKACHQKNLENREALSYERYKEFYTFETPVDGSELTLPEYETGICRLSALKDHKRIYEPVSADS